MAQALITVNGVIGANDNVPINVLVQLSNLNNGGEVSYLWALLDQPEGAAVLLSSSTVQNPSFTPTKEGTYELQLIVNQGLATQATATAFVAVRYLKSNQRAPAALETTEASTSAGWKTAMNRLLALVDKAQGDANLVVAQANASVTAGMVVQFSGVQTIKSGLPGQVNVALVSPLATAGVVTTGVPFGVVVASVTGGPTQSNLVYVRVFGLSELTASGSPSVGASVYCDPTLSTPTLTASAGKIGFVVQAGGGTYQYIVDGQGTFTTTPGAFLGRQLFSGNGTYTPTPGARTVRVRMVGGGGGGGGCTTGANVSASGSGGSGVYLEKTITAAAGSLITGGAVTIGAFGAGGAAGNNSGVTGGDTSVVINGVTLTAKGGTGGAGTGNSTSNVGLGGGTQAGSSAGDVVFECGGGSGVVVSASLWFSTGPGGSNPLGGTTMWAFGGAGAVGQGFGSGGNGAVINAAGGASAAGGNGAPGVVIIEEWA